MEKEHFLLVRIGEEHFALKLEFIKVVGLIDTTNDIRIADNSSHKCNLFIGWTQLTYLSPFKINTKSNRLTIDTAIIDTSKLLFKSDLEYSLPLSLVVYQAGENFISFTADDAINVSKLNREDIKQNTTSNNRYGDYSEGNVLVNGVDFTIINLLEYYFSKDNTLQKNRQVID